MFNTTSQLHWNWGCTYAVFVASLSEFFENYPVRLPVKSAPLQLGPAMRSRITAALLISWLPVHAHA